MGDAVVVHHAHRHGRYRAREAYLEGHLAPHLNVDGSQQLQIHSEVKAAAIAVTAFRADAEIVYPVTWNEGVFTNIPTSGETNQTYV